MNYAEFRRIAEENRAKKPHFDEYDAELKLTDNPATDEDIVRVEAEIGAKLPIEYVMFLKDYGGGMFYFGDGAVDIYSADPNGDSARIGFELPIHPGQDFVAVSEDGWGNYYGFIVVDGQCQSPIWFSDHEDNFKLSQTKWDNILSFLIDGGG